MESSADVFFRFRKGKVTWNVLENVDRLPELDKEFANKPYIEDKMSIRLIEGFGGSARDSLALSLFTHVQRDMRSISFSMEEKSMPRATWRRGILLATDGRRFMTNLFQDEALPDQIWLHNSGRIVMGRYGWGSPSSGRKVQLSETRVHFQRNGD